MPLNEVMFSVIIPIYNSRSYLDKTLASLALQSFTDFEVIIVDDRSTDGSFVLAQELIKKYSLVGSVNEKPVGMAKGVSSARNYGVALSRREWIAFLDSDDLFHKEKLFVLSESIFLQSDVQFYHHAVKRISEYELPEISGNISDVVLRSTYGLYNKNSIVTSSVVLRRKLFDSLGGFNEKLNGVEDYNLWLRASCITTLMFIDVELGVYRVREISLMGGRRFAYYVGQSILLMGNIEFLKPEQQQSVARGVKEDLVTYYSNISIQYYGYFSILPGLVKLFVNGYGATAIHIFYLKTRDFLLKNIS